jgi:hypothetical protein
VAQCTRQNPYTCPQEPHEHTEEEVVEKLTKNAEAFEWTMREMWSPKGKEKAA